MLTQVYETCRYVYIEEKKKRNSEKDKTNFQMAYSQHRNFFRIARRIGLKDSPKKER